MKVNQIPELSVSLLNNFASNAIVQESIDDGKTNGGESIECLAQLLQKNDSNNFKMNQNTNKLLQFDSSFDEKNDLKRKIAENCRVKEKTPIEVDDDIIAISDSEVEPSKNDSKRRKILIGNNIEKLPELSHSTLTRELDNIANEAIMRIGLNSSSQEEQFIQNAGEDLQNLLSIDRSQVLPSKSDSTTDLLGLLGIGTSFKENSNPVTNSSIFTESPILATLTSNTFASNQPISLLCANNIKSNIHSPSKSKSAHLNYFFDFGNF